MLRYQSHKKEQHCKICRRKSFEMRKSIAETLFGDDWKPDVNSLEISEHNIIDVVSICFDDVANLGGEEAVAGRGFRGY